MSLATKAIWAALAGFKPRRIEPPVLQPAGLYLELMGEDIRARAFLAEGGGPEGLCLRPDMTVPALRLALAQGAHEGAIAYEGLVFRRQTEGATKESEFTQIGLELLSRSAVAREADLIAAALTACRAVGAEPRLILGHAGLWTASADAVGLDPSWRGRLERAFARGGSQVMAQSAADALHPDPIAEAIGALNPADAESAVTAMLAGQAPAPMAGRSAANIAARLRAKAAALHAPRPTTAQIETLATAMTIKAAPADALKQLTALTKQTSIVKAAPLQAAIDELASCWSAIGSPPPEAILNPGFGRGLAFYDGLVFELEAPALGARASLGGGGRYDRLVSALGGPAGLGAVGFALRPQRIAEAGQ
jgi:ATP phosphoribosyltransferase regulatory subunit